MSVLRRNTGGFQGVSRITEYNGNLYVIGKFNLAGGVVCHNIAEWNGTSWAAVGGGLNNAADGITVYNGNLVLGGVFDSAGGVPAMKLAQWNDSAWSEFGGGIYGNDTVYALVTSLYSFDDNLIVGGRFSKAGTVNVANVAEWVSSTGIKDITGSINGLIFPNPASNIITIEGLPPGTPICIHNMLGQIVFETISAGEKQTIDVGKLSAGMYFINGAKFVKK